MREIPNTLNAWQAKALTLLRHTHHPTHIVLRIGKNKNFLWLIGFFEELLSLQFFLYEQ